MRTRSMISLFTLIVFLPCATGCSTTRTIYVRNDAVTDKTTAEIARGREVWVTGYTTRFDGYHRWKGHVSVAGPDSLEFAQRDRESDNWRSPKAPPFRLASADVISLEVQTGDGARTVGVVALVVGVLALVLFVAMARALNDAFDEDNWFQGTK